MPAVEARSIERFKLAPLDRRIFGWMRCNGLFVLRVGPAAVFVWFGLPKPLEISPAEGVAWRVVYGIPRAFSYPSWAGGKSRLVSDCCIPHFIGR